jgi:ubiquinone/menaquinone biosynthesis C-methylase UbiE
VINSADAKLVPGLAAGTVFDRIAASYDHDFTDSLIGRAQRSLVWKVLLKTFRPNDNVLELNCGTGEDALFLASNGISVFACDASQQMIFQAESRLQKREPAPPIVFCHLPTERITDLDPSLRFDGAFSNFSGLNCVADLASVSNNLSSLIKTGGSLVLCLSTRVCLTEIVYYALQGEWRKGIRRCKGESLATLEGAALKVYYPTLRQIVRSFKPNFRLRSVRGVGVAIPPSYLECWARRHTTAFGLLCHLETLLARLPILRTSGDHILLCFEKVLQ